MTRKLSVQAKASSLAIAVALVAGPSPAAAESLKGTPTVTFGSGSIGETATTTDVTIGSSQVVIDWTPDDNAIGNFGAIAFQDSGTTANFNGASDFAVLNRVNVADPTRLVFMNGNINSSVDGVAGRGSVFFYSPSGFVIGANAVINVGSLVLSASPIAVDGNGNFMNGTSVTFNQAPNPNALINTVAGSQINANGTGSYVALIAPQVTHHGTIRTDGAAALVAAEAATINFSPDGLFDISVTVGTDAGTGIHVDGGSITRNSASEPINHRAYLVAVAKNDAVTMLINNGGSVGFETATSAQNGENNSVILSGGYDVGGGFRGSQSGVSQVDLTITNATLSSNVDATVTGGASVSSGQGDLVFGGDLSLVTGGNSTTGGNALVDGANAHTLTIAGNLFVQSSRKNADGSSTGLISRLGAEGGSTVNIGGDVTLISDSFGANGLDTGENGTNATGGNAQINIGSNSTLHIGGSATVQADGYGGHVFGSDATAGSGTGGQALVMAINGSSSVTIDGSVYASAQGFGGTTGECSICNVTGGNGIGGNASVHTNVGSGNQLILGSDVTVTAAGWGGAGDAQAGNGFGGTANLGAANNSTLSVAADSEVDADGNGGFGFDSANGGLGRGGTATVGAHSNASMDLTGPLFVHSDGYGGDGLNGGTGTGGIASFVATAGGTVHAFDDVEVSANSNGGFTNTESGDGGAGLADNESTVTPGMTEAAIFVNGASLTVDGIAVVSANATGGDGGFNGGNGGNAVAAGVPGVIDGGAIIHAANNDTATSFITLGTVIVTSDAQGGNGGNGQSGTNGTNGGNGGNATAGKTVVTASAGSGNLTAGTTIVSSSATGGQGGDGGNGDGGSSGNGGNGGDAFGGFINIGTESGNQNFAQAANNGQASFDSIIAIADATGGNGGGFLPGNPTGTPGNGGDAFGGSSTLLVRGSLVTVDSVLLDASATGGDGGMDSNDVPQGTGGDAVTGAVGVLVTNRFQHLDQRGTLSAGNIAGTATATGGQGTVAGSEWTQGGSEFVVVNSDATIDSVGIVVTAADGLAPSPLPLFNNPIAVVNGTVTIANGFAFQTPGTVSVYADDPTPNTPSLTATTINISAGNFIHDDDPSRTGPASFGRLAAGNIVLTTGQDIIVDAHMFSANGVNFNAPGLIDIQNLNSNGPIALTAGSTVDAGNLSGGLVNVSGGGNVTLGSVNTTSQGAVISSTNGNIVTGAINAATFIGLNALLGSITTGDLNSGSLDVFAQADDGITTGDIDAGTNINIISASGFVNVGDLAGTEINLDAGGAVTFGDVVADGLDFDAGTTANGGNIVAGTEVKGDAQGAITLGNINVGLIQTGGAADEGFAVGISSPGSIVVGNVAADESIGFATFANLTTGTLNSGTLVMTLVGGNTTIASITTPSTGRVYHGDSQMFIDAGGGNDNFDVNLVLAQNPLRSGGSYTVNGAISTGQLQVGAASISTGAITAPVSVELDAANNVATGNIAGGDHITLNAGSGSIAIGNATATNAFQADAGTSFSAGAIGAGDISVVAGGLVTVGGAWSGGDVEVVSNDIDITASGSISAGDLGLISTNATQTVVGDGVAGGGYQLADAEYDRLHSNDINVIADTSLGAAAKMLIGDLTVDGSDSEAIHDYEFVTIDGETETPEGSIRIVGDAVFSNMGTDQSVTFTTNRFELDAATGLLSLEQGPGVLGGQLFLDAAHIHVASGTILDQLAADPQYDGYVDDLNDPAAVQRPDGVLRAAAIEIEFADGGPATLNTLYVQNTGTAGTPAGFVVSDGVLFGDGGDVTPPPGSIDVVINGQIVTQTGTLTGVDVRDALVESEGDLSPFTQTSTVNGCLLTGACGGGGGGGDGGPIPEGGTPTPGIQDIITLVEDDAFPEPDFGNEDTIDDNDEETDDSATSPITPPDPLFDTSEVDDEAAGGTEGPEVGTTMRSTPGLTSTGDVDDPVSGSGNPGLMDNPPPPTDNQEKQP